MNIGEKVKSLREDMGINQMDFAKMVSLNNSVLSRIESGERPVRDEELLRIADVLRVSTDFLLGRTNEKSLGDRISNAIKDDAELARFWETMKERPELKIMFNQTKDLSPKAIQQVIRIIKAIEDEEDREDG